MVTASFVFDLTEVATQAIEAAAGIGALIQGFKLVEISRNYYNLYNAQRTFYYNVFQLGVEVPLLAEVYAMPVYAIDYAGRIATAYSAINGPFGGKSTDTAGWWKRHANMYAFAPDPLITALPVDKAAIQSDWANYLFRFEELWADIRNDERWSRRLAIHNIGLKQTAEVSTALDSALGQYQDNIEDMSDQLATYGNGIAKYVGYKRGLADMSAEMTHGTGYGRNVSYANASIEGTTTGGGMNSSSPSLSPWTGAPMNSNLVGIQ